MTRDDLFQRAFNAAMWNSLSEADAFAWVDKVLGLIAAAIQKDPRFPRQTRNEIDLIFGDARQIALEDLTRLIDDKVDLADAVDAVIDALQQEKAKSKTTTVRH